MSSSLRPWIMIGASGIGIILLGAFVLDLQRPPSLLLTSAAEAPVAATADTPAWSPPSVIQDGIEVAISRLERTDGNLRLTIIMNNHQYDLSALDVKTFTTLNNLPPLLYTVLTSGSGGHHVEAELLFETDAAGELVLGLDADRRFIFQLL